MAQGKHDSDESASILKDDALDGIAGGLPAAVAMEGAKMMLDGLLAQGWTLPDSPNARDSALFALASGMTLLEPPPAA